MYNLKKSSDLEKGWDGDGFKRFGDLSVYQRSSGPNSESHGEGGRIHFTGGLFYVVSGYMRVECVSHEGKKILVDNLGPDNFTGKISRVQKAYFACDIFAATDCDLLFLESKVYEAMMKDKGFSELFYRKISNRVYQMYKGRLVRSFYSLAELVAYHICSRTGKDQIFEYRSTLSLCEELDISRRGLYNILNKFLEKGYLEKEVGSSRYYVRNRRELEKICSEVRRYMEEQEP